MACSSAAVVGAASVEKSASALPASGMALVRKSAASGVGSAASRADSVVPGDALSVDGVPFTSSAAAWGAPNALSSSALAWDADAAPNASTRSPD